MRLNQLLTFALVALPMLSQAQPNTVRHAQLTVQYLPQPIDVEARVAEALKSQQRSGNPVATSELNRKFLRQDAEFQRRGATLKGRVQFATDGTWYESETFAPFVANRVKALPNWMRYDGNVTVTRNGERTEVLTGDQRGLYVTFGDSLFLFGRLPEQARETKRTVANGLETVEYQGDLGVIAGQLTRVVYRNGVPISAESGRASDALKYPIARFRTDGNKVIVERFAGPNKRLVIETYQGFSSQPYQPILKLQPGDPIIDQRFGQEYRYEWAGKFQAPPSPMTPEGNPFFTFWVASALSGVLIIGYGVLKRRARSHSGPATA
ncbi:MAG: hypothetical protein SFX74_01290 [Fimbriimonadaceae bacterium]|nr:hypothetical protein [Fimbriimonadaceae bacterium]